MTQTTSLNQSIGVVLVLSLVGLMLAVTAGAATTDTVAATVTPQFVAVSVSDGDVAYGILDVNTSADTTTTGLADVQTATNDGNVTAKLDIKSSDAIGGTPWNLAAAAGADAFTHEFSKDDGSSYTAFNADNTTYVALAASVAAAGTQAFDLKIGSPTSASDSAEKTITVTVLVTAI